MTDDQPQASRVHQYQVSLTWTGDRGSGTSGYTRYGRDHVVTARGPAPILGSADPGFRGDATRWNPEQLLVAAIAECHLLWYLHLAAAAGVVVVGYRDSPTGTMAEDADGGGHFTEVTLRPEVVVTDESMLPAADSLHEQAHRLCFIARSVNFPVYCLPRSRTGEGNAATAGEEPPRRAPAEPG